MQITPIGYIFIPLGIIIYFFKKKYLFWAAILAMPLWNSSVLYVKVITFYFRTPFFFMSLLIVNNIVNTFTTGKWFKQKRIEDTFLVLFMFISGLSLLMPLIINGDVSTYSINDGLTPIPSKTPLYFGIINITQYLFLIFCCMYFFVLRKEIATKKRIESIINIMISLGIVAVVSGILHVIFTSCNRPEISLNFYRFMGAPDLSFARKMLFKKVPQMYSLLGEPGQMALFLVAPLGFTCIKFLSTENLLKTDKYSIFLILMITCLLISTSTAAHASIIVFLLSFLFISKLKIPTFRYIKAIIKIALVVGLSICLAYAIYYVFFNYSFSDFTKNTHVAKVSLQFGSGPARWHYAVENFNIFFKYPFLGVGIGSCNSSSMITALLSNTGILGTVSFLLFNFFIFKKTFKKYLTSNAEEESFYLGLLTIFTTYLALMLFTRSMAGLTTTQYWLLMAMMSSVSFLAKHNPPISSETLYNSNLKKANNENRY